MKQKNLRHILQHADDESVGRMAEISPMTDDTTKRRLRDAVQSRTLHTLPESAVAETYQAKPVRRSFGTALSAAAACLVIAGTAAGALYLKQGAKPILEPTSQAGESAGTQEGNLTETQPLQDVVCTAPFFGEMQGQELYVSGDVPDVADNRMLTPEQYTLLIDALNVMDWTEQGRFDEYEVPDTNFLFLRIGVPGGAEESTDAGVIFFLPESHLVLWDQGENGQVVSYLLTDAQYQTIRDILVPVETRTTPDYDMTTKMGVLGKMLNSVDFYHKVSGEFVRSETALVNGAGIVTFAVDADAWESNQTLVRGSLIPSAEEVLAGAEPEFAVLAYYDENGGLRIYTKERQQYQIFDNESGAWYTASYLYGSGAKDAPVDPEAFLAYLSGGDQLVPDPEGKFSREMAGDAYLASNCIQPQYYVQTYLADFDAWEITGEITYTGRDCVTLAGHYAATDGDFAMYVDKATGCLLYAECYDADGKLLEWLMTRSIAFDEDAAPVGDPLDGRQEWIEREHTTERPDDIPALWEGYGTNSHGETYASAGQMRIERGNYDQLPDLIRFGGVVDEYGRRNNECFVKKTELFEVFGDDPDTQMSRLMQDHDKTATAVPVKTLNVYDIEGETVLYTVTYYDEPDAK